MITRSFVFFCALLVASVAVAAPQPLPPAPERPTGSGGPTRIEVAGFFIDIIQIDSAAQTFQANLAFTLQWQDPSLAHAGPGVVQYALADVWHPNAVIANAGGSTFRATLPEVVSVTPEGIVTYKQRVVAMFNERMNLRRFPFDRETFVIRIAALNSSPEDMVFVPNAQVVADGSPDAVNSSNEFSIQDWIISGLSAGPAPYRVSPKTVLAGYEIRFTASRNPQHYLLKVLLPLLLIVLMSWSVFWIDPSMGASQISVAVTSVLTLIAYRFAIGAEVPKLPYLTLLDSFILVSTVLVFLSLIEVVATTAMALKGDLAGARRLDFVARWVFPTVFFTICGLLFFL